MSVEEGTAVGVGVCVTVAVGGMGDRVAVGVVVAGIVVFTCDERQPASKDTDSMPAIIHPREESRDMPELYTAAKDVIRE